MELGDFLCQVILLIWDEVSIQHRFRFEAIDRMLQDIWNNDRFFGGLPVIIRRDFAQISPIIYQGTIVIIIKTCIQYCYIWPQLFFLFLHQNMQLL